MKREGSPEGLQGGAAAGAAAGIARQLEAPGALPKQGCGRRHQKGAARPPGGKPRRRGLFVREGRSVTRGQERARRAGPREGPLQRQARARRAGAARAARTRRGRAESVRGRRRRRAGCGRGASGVGLVGVARFGRAVGTGWPERGPQSSRGATRKSRARVAQAQVIQQRPSRPRGRWAPARGGGGAPRAAGAGGGVSAAPAPRGGRARRLSGVL